MGRSYNYYHYNTFYEKTTPIEVENGISLKKQRGDVGEHWWSKKWIAYLKSLNMGARLTRGKAYARKGQIISLEIRNAIVIAKVQGSYREPYTVQIRLQSISSPQWKKIINLLASQAIYASKLLNGKMPQNIEGLFTEASVELFPSSKGDLKTDCSCPDYANPCKHIAAVYYLLAEKFDENPFLIFELRGKSKDALISMLREIRTKKALDSPPQSEDISRKITNMNSGEKKSLLEKGNGFFWHGEKAKYVNSISFSPSNLNAELLAKIEPSPITIENKNLSNILRKTYLSLTNITLERINQSFKLVEEEMINEGTGKLKQKINVIVSPDLKKTSNQKILQKINSIVNEKDLKRKWELIENIQTQDEEFSSIPQKHKNSMINALKSLILEWMEYEWDYRPDNTIVQAILTLKHLLVDRRDKIGKIKVSGWDYWFHNFWRKHFRFRNLKKEFRKQNFLICRVEDSWTLLNNHNGQSN